MATDPFEERAVVVADEDDAPPSPPPSPARRRRHSTRTPVGAYLAALDELERDGRWAREPAETPAAHADRVRRQGLAAASLGRMAAAYQLVRYGAVDLGAREGQRSAGRLRRLRGWLRGHREGPVS